MFFVTFHPFFHVHATFERSWKGPSTRQHDDGWQTHLRCRTLSLTWNTMNPALHHKSLAYVSRVLQKKYSEEKTSTIKIFYCAWKQIIHHKKMLLNTSVLRLDDANYWTISPQFEQGITFLSGWGKTCSSQHSSNLSSYFHSDTLQRMCLRM